MYNCLYISDIEISEMKILIMRILNKHYVPLINLPKTCFEEVAAELYSAGLISTAVIPRAPTFDNVIKEFEAGMSFKRSLSELQEHLLKFITSLNKVGGHFAALGSVLQDEWTKTIRRELKVELDLYYLTSKSEKRRQYKRQRDEDFDYDDTTTSNIKQQRSRSHDSEVDLNHQSTKPHVKESKGETL